MISATFSDPSILPPSILNYTNSTNVLELKYRSESIAVIYDNIATV